MSLLRKLRKPASYFDSLTQDLDSLGVFPPTFGVKGKIPKIKDSYTLFSLVERTSWRIGTAQRYRPENFPDGADDLKTEFGRYALSLIDLSTRTYSGLGLCSEAEPGFVRSMQADEIENEQRFSPIIVTRSDEPVGILKPIGEMSYYTLERDTRSKTYAGHIYWTLINKHYAFGEDLAAPHAWNMPIEEAGDRLRNGRLSTFLIPQEERQTLRATYDEDVSLLRQSHAGLQAAAALALENSVRIHFDPSCK